MPRCAEPRCQRWRAERLTPARAVGIRLNGLWYCGHACVQHAARHDLDRLDEDGPGEPASGSPLGVWLRRQGAIDERDLDAALTAQRVSGRRLGQELIHLGRASRDQVLRALAAQANVPCLTVFEPGQLPTGSSWLPHRALRALGLVPFDLDRERRVVHVLCAAPVRGAAVRALEKLTGWRPRLFLVHDETFVAAVRLYRQAGLRSPEPDVVTVGGMDDVAALVADTASTDRAVVMRHARWDREMWIQVEGPTDVSNLLVPGAMEGTCQVAHTPR